eukprot:scaffold1149_cov236-Pinguiococcus_pyrenoidosus.AAC.6
MVQALRYSGGNTQKQTGKKREKRNKTQSSRLEDLLICDDNALAPSWQHATLDQRLVHLGPDGKIDLGSAAATQHVLGVQNLPVEHHNRARWIP